MIYSENKNLQMVAKTLYGLEGVLADEIRAIGGKSIREGNRAVEFTGGKEILYKANFHLRTATRILVSIASFRCRDEFDLYREVKNIKWPQYLKADGSLAISAVLNRSNLDNTHYAALKTKDAIVDRFRDEFGKRPDVDLDNPDLRISVHVHQNKATIALDSSGEPLFRRGYRIEGGVAPLSEVLAAGIIYLTGWDKKIPLVDPMCGSGTIPVEAAMLAKNIAPGLVGRKYGFMKWKDFDRDLLEKIKIDAKSEIIRSCPAEIIGSDMSAKCIDEARGNAKRAGVSDAVKFAVKRMEKIGSDREEGCLIMNPPYGERLAVGEKRKFYGMIGDSLKNNFTGFTAWVLTGNLDAPVQIGLRPKRKIKLYNSPIECRLLKYELYSGSRKQKYQLPEGDQSV